MKKLLITTLIISLSGIIFWFGAEPVRSATIYYVDATGGSDANAGTSEATAWQTVNKVNTSTFTAGDIIKFKRGEVWREQLNPPSSGASGNHITFTNYGTGNLPKIVGSDDYSATGSWTDLTGNIWATSNGSLTTDVAQIWHDETASNRETAEAGLNTQWDFWYDSANTRVKVYSTSNPGGLATQLEIVQRTFAVEDGGSQYITLDGLFIGYVHQHCINLTSIDNWTVRNSEISYCGGQVTANAGNGVEISGTSQGFLFEDNTFKEAYDTCFSPQITGTANTIQDVTVQNNTFLRCGEGVELQTFSGGHTIQNVTIRNNTFTDTGNVWSRNINNMQEDAITIFVNSQTIDDITITGNTISNPDGEGMYFNGAITNYVIEKNIIYGAEGSTTGAGIGLRFDCSGGNSTGIIRNNLIYDNVHSELYWNACTGDQTEVYNNTVVDDSGDPDVLVDMVGASDAIFKNNIFYTTDALTFRSTTPTSTLDYNIHYRASGNMITWGASTYTLAQFSSYQTDSSQDANSLAVDPSFTDLSGDDYTLASGSQAINAGDDTAHAGFTTDILNNPKDGATWDMGAYEFQTTGSNIIRIPGGVRFQGGVRFN